MGILDKVYIKHTNNRINSYHIAVVVNGKFFSDMLYIMDMSEIEREKWIKSADMVMTNIQYDEDGSRLIFIVGSSLPLSTQSLFENHERNSSMQIDRTFFLLQQDKYNKLNLLKINKAITNPHIFFDDCIKFPMSRKTEDRIADNRSSFTKQCSNFPSSDRLIKILANYSGLNQLHRLSKYNKNIIKTTIADYVNNDIPLDNYFVSRLQSEYFKGDCNSEAVPVHSQQEVVHDSEAKLVRSQQEAFQNITQIEKQYKNNKYNIRNERLKWNKDQSDFEEHTQILLNEDDVYELRYLCRANEYINSLVNNEKFAKEYFINNSEDIEYIYESYEMLNMNTINPSNNEIGNNPTKQHNLIDFGINVTNNIFKDKPDRMDYIDFLVQVFTFTDGVDSADVSCDKGLNMRPTKVNWYGKVLKKKYYNLFEFLICMLTVNDELNNEDIAHIISSGNINIVHYLVTKLKLIDIDYMNQTNFNFFQYTYDVKVISYFVYGFAIQNINREGDSTNNTNTNTNTNTNKDSVTMIPIIANFDEYYEVDMKHGFKYKKKQPNLHTVSYTGFDNPYIGFGKAKRNNHCDNEGCFFKDKPTFYGESAKGKWFIPYMVQIFNRDEVELFKFLYSRDSKGYLELIQKTVLLSKSVKIMKYLHEIKQLGKLSKSDLNTIHLAALCEGDFKVAKYLEKYCHTHVTVDKWLLLQMISNSSPDIIKIFFTDVKIHHKDIDVIRDNLPKNIKDKIDSLTADEIKKLGIYEHRWVVDDVHEYQVNKIIVAEKNCKPINEPYMEVRYENPYSFNKKEQCDNEICHKDFEVYSVIIPIREVMEWLLYRNVNYNVDKLHFFIHDLRLYTYLTNNMIYHVINTQHYTANQFLFMNMNTGKHIKNENIDCVYINPSSLQRIRGSEMRLFFLYLRTCYSHIIYLN